jgi:hypothetical protein
MQVLANNNMILGQTRDIDFYLKTLQEKNHNTTIRGVFTEHSKYNESSPVHMRLTNCIYRVDKTNCSQTRNKYHGPKSSRKIPIRIWIIFNSSMQPLLGVDFARAYRDIRNMVYHDGLTICLIF